MIKVLGSALRRNTEKALIQLQIDMAVKSLGQEHVLGVLKREEVSVDVTGANENPS